VSKKKIALIVVGGMLVALIVGAVIVDAKTRLLLGSPRVSSEVLVKPETRLQIVANIPLARDVIEKKLLQGVNVPEWIIPLVLPYEAALVVNTDYVLGDMNMTLFVNDRRVAPLILSRLNALRLPKPLDAWFPEKMAAKRRGMLVRQGSAKMDRDLLGRVKAQWKGTVPGAPCRIEGGHMIEAVLDNRDGAAIAMAGAVATAQGLSIPDITDSQLGFASSITSVRVQADIAPDNTLKVHAAVECKPGTEPGSLSLIKVLAFDVFGTNIKGTLAQKGISVSGEAVVDGTTVKGDYTVSNFDAILAML
jgi:hypothetical protein